MPETDEPDRAPFAGDPAASHILELALPPGLVAHLLRAPALRTRRAGRMKTVPANIVWHDTADGALAEDGLALGQGSFPDAACPWRLERLRPDGAMDWLPATPPPLVCDAPTRAELAYKLPGPLTPVAAFRGTARSLALSGHGVEQLTVLDGTLRGVTEDRPACRILLRGQVEGVADLAMLLAETVPVSVPQASLAAEALAVACHRPPAPRRRGGPCVPSGLSVDEALAMVTAHLADVALYWAPFVPMAERAEPVHQMRVAVRRLRSALVLFRRAIEGDEAAPWLAEMAAQLKSLAARLGAARDWDVFLDETGHAVGLAFPGDKRIVHLLAAAEKRRQAAYAALVLLFDSPEWTRLSLTLALLPFRAVWRSGAGSAALLGPVDAYAEGALRRRLRAVLAPGESLSALSAPALHEVRKQAKRLRYATEFFALLFPGKSTRRYLSRLESLQEVLGAVNDTAVASALMAQLGGGADRAFASGVVQGYGAGRNAHAMGQVEHAWSRFYRAEPFWD